MHCLGERYTVLLVAVVLHQVRVHQPLVGAVLADGRERRVVCSAVPFIEAAVRLLEERGNDSVPCGTSQNRLRRLSGRAANGLMTAIGAGDSARWLI